MTFQDFCRLHGLLVDHLLVGKWVATPTEDHPRKRNGRYKLLGDIGWVQNWATMQAPAMWRDGNVSRAVVRQMMHDADRERRELAEKAAAKAAWIMHQTKPDTHPYLKAKGFPEEVGNVWDREGQKILVIPMRLGNRLIGCQLISDDGAKKFLHGQHTKGASFILDAKGVPIFCEGYATGLSIRAVMKATKIRYKIIVCFSASNLEEVSRHMPGGIVVADNDANGVGEKSARATNKPYWISDTVGEDFNDYHLRVGLFHASQSLKPVLFSGSSASSSAGT